MLKEMQFKKGQVLIREGEQGDTAYVIRQGRVAVSNRLDLCADSKPGTKMAEAVRDYWVGQGVATERLSAKGYGKILAIADNNTRAGRAKKWRVELRRSNYSQSFF